MSRQLFGTDGIRGVAGQYPLDPPTVFAFGRALGAWVRDHQPGAPAVLMGMDTRESGPWLAEHVAGGLALEGAQPHFAGVITTPGVAWLTRHGEFVAGVMISASHNLYEDNGLKVFDHSGFKLPDEEEHRLEQRIFAQAADGRRAAPARIEVEESLDEEYLHWLASTFPRRLEGMRLVLDTAHGAACRLAPLLFERLGAEVIATGCSPNGRNINRDCGALHIGHLRHAVLHHQAHVGAAFDGDADRCMIVSGSGKLIDGDHILLVVTRHLAARGAAPGSVIATVMSNLGLERALAASGILLRRTAVGDKYVLEEMVKNDLPIGGEQSGHVIFRQYATTGDGLLTALRVVEAMQESGRNLDDLTADFAVYPQRLVNVRFRERRPLEQLASVQAEIAAAREEFGDAGRVLVRFSGTEPLARVMVEGPDAARVDHFAGRIAAAIGAELGQY